MSLASYRILDTLAAAPEGALRMGALAERLGASSSRLAHATRRLEESGWVRRQASPSDGRGQVAVLTEAGRAALRAAAPVRAEVVRRHLLAPLSADQVTQLRRIGEALCDRAAPAAPPITGRRAGRGPV